MSDNTNLGRARAAGDDEFYTALADVEREVAHYRAWFKGRRVLCDCDDPEWSNFYRYFSANYEVLGLEGLVCTHFEPSPDRPSYALVREGDGDEVRVPLKGNGDFRSPECLAYLDWCDVVVTNPPFSLFREFVPTVLSRGKELLVIGPLNALTYTGVLPAVVDGRLGVGVNHVKAFTRADGSVRRFGNTLWYTTLDHPGRHGGPVLYRSYAADPSGWRVHDHAPALECPRVSDMPVDYDGLMAVPVTYIDHHDPSMFEIVGTLGAGGPLNRGPSSVGGEARYKRLLVRRRSETPSQTL